MATKLVPLDFEHLATLDDGRIDQTFNGEPGGGAAV